jgi:predicted outer membrane repeat protein
MKVLQSLSTHTDTTVSVPRSFCSDASTVYGGSLVVNGDLTTYNCTFMNNTAANSEARGGAIAAFLQANVRLYNTNFYGNAARYVHCTWQCIILW